VSSPAFPNIGAVDVVIGAKSPEVSGDNGRVSDAAELVALAPFRDSGREVRANEMLGRLTSLLLLV
jgi:hypothetical protein